jgi:hypothetical protein
MDVFKNLLLSNPRTYTGSGVGLLEASNNLSDVGDAVTAAGNLGVYTKAESNTRLNALAPRQAIQLPAGINATGVSGLNFGTGDFSIALPSFRLADYTISDTDAANLIFQSHNTGNNRVRVGVRLTGGVWRIAFTDDSGVDTTYAITPTVALVDNTVYSVTLVFNRSGDAVFYVNGVANGSVSIAAAAAIDIGSGNTNGYRLNGGTASVMMLAAAITYNFALPATTTSGVPGVDVRYADGVWVRPSERGQPSNDVVGAGTAASLGTTDADSTTGFSLSNGTLSAVAGAATGSVGSWFLRSTTTGSASTVRLDLPLFTIAAGAQIRVVAKIKSSIASGNFELIARNIANSTITAIDSFGVSTTKAHATYADWVEATWELTTRLPLTRLQLALGVDETGGNTFDIDDLLIYVNGSTLDLNPQGIGRTIIDRSANRNHATVSGTTLPTTPEIDLGNVSAGEQYVSGLVLATGVPTAITLITSIAATANLWCASDSTDVIIHTITYERISD